MSSIPLEKKLALVRQIREQSDSNMQAMNLRCGILGFGAGTGRALDAGRAMDEELPEQSTFSIRLFLAGMLFLLYVSTDFLGVSADSILFQAKGWLNALISTDMFEFMARLTDILHSVT